MVGRHNVALNPLDRTVGKNGARTSDLLDHCLSLLKGSCSVVNERYNPLVFLVDVTALAAFDDGSEALGKTHCGLVFERYDDLARGVDISAFLVLLDGSEPVFETEPLLVNCGDYGVKSAE